MNHEKSDDPLFTVGYRTDVIGGHSVSNKGVSL